MAKENTQIQNSGSEMTPTPGVPGTVEVLYQKMGDRWFAFSLVDDEVFVGSITQEEIDHRKRNHKPHTGSA